MKTSPAETPERTGDLLESTDSLSATRHDDDYDDRIAVNERDEGLVAGELH